MPLYKITLKQTLTRLAYGEIEAENEEQAKQDDADPEIGDCEIKKM